MTHAIRDFALITVFVLTVLFGLEVMIARLLLFGVS
jgi:hypothetical protein